MKFGVYERMVFLQVPIPKMLLDQCSYAKKTGDGYVRNVPGSGSNARNRDAGYNYFGDFSNIGYLSM